MTQVLSDWSTPVHFEVQGNPWPSGEVQKLFANDAAILDYFGSAVALNSAGDLALIGASGDNDAATDGGSVYVFTRSGVVWTQQQKLTASDAASADYFGVSAALNAAGDLALIGAHAVNGAATDTGAVYVFTRSGSIWTQQQKLTASDGAAADYFGISVALNGAGDLALIGADSVNNAGGEDAGCVYVFTRAGDVWTQQQKLTASDGAAANCFGSSTALNAAGDLALIGAYAGDGVVADAGCVYVFTRAGDVWTQQQKLTASDSAQGDSFGISAAVNAAGDLAMIGAQGVDGTLTDTGCVYVFTRSGDVWTQQQKLTASDGAAAEKDYFGASVALNAVGDLGMIGAYKEDSAATDAGAIYVFK